MPASPSLTTADVARVVGVSEARVRQFVRAGWCAPERSGRSFVFRFQDLVVLRAANSLYEAHVPAARVRRALRALARELGDARSLSGLRIAADGRRVVVHHEGAQFEPESGQLVLDFSLDALAKHASKVTRTTIGANARSRTREDHAARNVTAAETATPANRALAERAYGEALALEARDPAAAQRAYRRALARDPALVEAAVNLARLLHEAGRAKDAVALYREALGRAPDDAEIHYNLALALEDTAGAAAAIAEYECALALDAGFADAHWNLAGLLEAAGKKAEALRHYRAYQKLTC